MSKMGDSGDLIASLRAIPSDFFIKPALGNGAPAADDSENRRAAEAYYAGDELKISNLLVEEQWLIQERVPVIREFRVHTLGPSVIPYLTFDRHRSRPVKTIRDGPVNYVSSIMEKLPPPFRFTCIGWLGYC
jgi:hypothetical protein